MHLILNCNPITQFYEEKKNRHQANMYTIETIIHLLSCHLIDKVRLGAIPNKGTINNK